MKPGKSGGKMKEKKEKKRRTSGWKGPSGLALRRGYLANPRFEQLFYSKTLCQRHTLYIRVCIQRCTKQTPPDNKSWRLVNVFLLPRRLLQKILDDFPGRSPRLSSQLSASPVPLLVFPSAQLMLTSISGGCCFRLTQSTWLTRVLVPRYQCLWTV